MYNVINLYSIILIFITTLYHLFNIYIFPQIQIFFPKKVIKKVGEFRKNRNIISYSYNMNRTYLIIIALKI